MHILTAITKGVLRKANDLKFNSDKKHAQANAYKRTGKDFKYNHNIDGSKQYRKYYNKELEKAQRKWENRDKFINDL